MKNRYVKPCSICGGSVPAGAANLRKSGEQSDWEVLHGDSCARDSVSRGYARAYTQRAVVLLNRSDASSREVNAAIDAFLNLVSTGWTTLETAADILWNSKALVQFDRLDAEEFCERLMQTEGSREMHA